MSELGHRIGRADSSDGDLHTDLEWDSDTKEALGRKGVKFFQLDRSAGEVLSAFNLTHIDREADDFIEGKQLRFDIPQFSEVGVLPEPISDGYEDLYSREAVMRNLALHMGQGLKPEEQAYRLLTPEFPDLLNVFAQLSQDPNTKIKNSWTNTRTYGDHFLVVSFFGENFAVSSESALGKFGGYDLVPIIVPVRLNLEQGEYLYPQIPDDLKIEAA